MYLWAGGSLGMPFGRDLCHTETGQLSCNANQLTGFYVARVFIERYFRRDIVVCL